jgi:LacI family transcriptional regulator
VGARLTMAQLAELAGVDVSTVSRALKGDSKRVAAATMARIQALAAENGYRPHATAAALRTGRTGVVGVLMPTLTDVVMATVFEAIAEAARAAGLQAVVATTHGGRAAHEQVVAGLMQRGVDGVILADSVLNRPISAELVESGIPFVCALRPHEEHAGVEADDHGGGALAARHLLDQGHREVWVLAGPSSVSTAAARLTGFRTTWRDGGGTLAGLRHGGFGVRDGYRATRRLLEDGEPPTAVFAVNDDNAVGAAHALGEHGVRVGADVALVGYNDVDVSSYLPVPLTSVRNDLARIGRTAVRLLRRRLRGETVTTVVVPPELIARASSAVRAEDLSPRSLRR